MRDKIKIAIGSCGGALLVIEAPTGVIYGTQAGGTMCAQPEAEGFVVFLDHFDWGLLYTEYRDLWKFAEPRTTTEVDELLDNAWDGRVQKMGLKIRPGATEWGEAWLPITCSYGDGWLTWPNSD